MHVPHAFVQITILHPTQTKKNHLGLFCYDIDMHERSLSCEAHKPTVKFTINQDIHKDAWNWWDAVNKISHGEKWIDRLPELEKKAVAEHCVGKTEDEALNFLIPYLEENYYKPKKISYDESMRSMNDLFENNFQKGCDKLVEVMGKPLFRNDFSIFLTTFNRGPYNKNDGWFMIGYNWNAPLKTALHEICHFQFINYWRENPDSEVCKMAFKDFDYLKESLTIILDEDFVEDKIIEIPDQGYKVHQELRLKLTNKWQETHNFDELVAFGVLEMKKTAI